MCKIKIILAFLALLPLPGFTQSSVTTPAPALAVSALVEETPSSMITSPSPALNTEESGLLTYVDFGGSSNSSGHIFEFGFSLGYEFNRHISVDARVPFYFVSSTTTGTATTGTTQQTTFTDHGIGDPSFSLILRFANRVLDYKTGVTTWVPVANMSSGFTTGSVLVDWNNRFSRPFGRLLLFGQVDIGNTVPDSPLFLLPYTAQGFNARFEGGAKVALTRILRAGASLYYVLPAGQQHLYSREVGDSGSGGVGTGGMGGGTGGMGGGMGGSGHQGQSGGNSGGWMNEHLTVGNDLTRDHGFSTWLTANLPHFVDLQIGFTRSYGYSLNTVSFGIGFDPIEALRHRHAE